MLVCNVWWALQVREESDESDSDDGPVVVELAETMEAAPEVTAEVAVAPPAAAPKLSWREKAALLRQQRQEQAA